MIKDMETKPILYKDYKNNGLVKNLIPVHINKCRSNNYFWDWSSEHQDWVRGKEIPEALKLAYKTPQTKSNY